MTRTAFVTAALATALLLPFTAAHAETCFTAIIDGTQAGTGSAGTGIGKFVLNDDETALTYKITFTGLGSAETAAHIHSDAEGGAVVKNLGTGSPKIGTWLSTDVPPLNAQRVADLKAGLMYTNIHSVTFPGGEIRGQMFIVPCEETCFDATIDGTLTGSAGTGTARMALNHNETELAYWVEFSGLGSPETAAHIHSNAEGGAVVHNLGTGSPKAGVWKFTDVPPLTAQRVKDLQLGLMYVNIHSIAFPAGEISGDVVSGTCDPQCLDAHLDGVQAGTTSTATGQGFFRLSHARNYLEYYVTTASVVNETAAHIHNQNEGDAVVANIGTGQSKTGQWDNDDIPPLDIARVGDVMSGAMYVNVHTTPYPGGEIRGQMNPIVCSATGIDDTPKPRTALAQNYPNPFNPTTTIEFTIASPTRVRLDVYDVAGRLVATLVNGREEHGRAVRWNGTDSEGRAVSSGVYFYRLVAGNVIETKKMVLLK